MSDILLCVLCGVRVYKNGCAERRESNLLSRRLSVRDSSSIFRKVCIALKYLSRSSLSLFLLSLSLFLSLSLSLFLSGWLSVLFLNLKRSF